MFRIVQDEVLEVFIWQSIGSNSSKFLYTINISSFEPFSKPKMLITWNPDDNETGNETWIRKKIILPQGFKRGFLEVVQMIPGKEIFRSCAGIRLGCVH